MITIGVTVGNASRLHVGDDVEVRFAVCVDGRPFAPPSGFSVRVQSPAQALAGNASTYVLGDESSVVVEGSGIGVFLARIRVLEDGVWKGTCLSPGPLGSMMAFGLL